MTRNSALNAKGGRNEQSLFQTDGRLALNVAGSAVYDLRRCNQRISAPYKRRYSLCLLTHNRMKIRCVIGTAHQRAGRDMLEAFLASDFTQEFELFRRDVFHHWQVLGTGPEILPHR
jgi:hypothetical protein